MDPHEDEEIQPYLSELLEICQNDPRNDERASELLEKIVKHAPSKWKRRLQSKLPRDRLGLEKWSRDSIKVPKAVVTELELWDKNPASFFNLTSSTSTNALTEVLSFLSNISGASPTRHIRLRIGQIRLYMLRTRLGHAQFRPGSGAEKEFLNRIQGDSESQKNAIKWAGIGHRYYLLSKDLGGLGSMICMPADISSTQLERIPLDGNARKDAIQCLKDRGIEDKADGDIELCYRVGKRIENIMKEVEESYFHKWPISNYTNKEPPKGQKRKTKGKLPDHRRRKGGASNTLPSSATNDSLGNLLDCQAVQQIALHNVAPQDEGGVAEQSNRPGHSASSVNLANNLFQPLLNRLNLTDNLFQPPLNVFQLNRLNLTNNLFQPPLSRTDNFFQQPLDLANTLFHPPTVDPANLTLR